VVRTQISLTDEQADRLRRLARRRRTSMAALIREAVDVVHPEHDDDSMTAKWERARRAVGGFQSGLPDVAERHDEYLIEMHSE
jgi:hypothetical protein